MAEQHNWPLKGEHLYGEWAPKDRSTVYRSCVHPRCNHVEYKKVT